LYLKKFTPRARVIATHLYKTPKLLIRNQDWPKQLLGTNDNLFIEIFEVEILGA